MVYRILIFLVTLYALLQPSMVQARKSRIQKQSALKVAASNPVPISPELAAEFSEVGAFDLYRKEPLEKEVINEAAYGIATEAPGVKQFKVAPEVILTTEQEGPAHRHGKIIGNYNLIPSSATDDKNDKIEVNLEDVDFDNLLKWVSDVFNVNFLTFDAFKPMPQGGKAVSGNTIVSFKTHTPLTKRQAWSLFLTFLDLFGFTLVPDSLKDSYRVMPTTSSNPVFNANKMPLPVFMDVNWKELPDNDSKIRYIYFVKNADFAILKDIITKLQSPTAGQLIDLPDLQALIMTDKSSNIRTVMSIVAELDNTAVPETLSVIRLKHTDAAAVKKIYDDLAALEVPANSPVSALIRAGVVKQSPSVYFPVGTRVLVEPRNNALIVLGPREGVQKVEKFITTYIDTSLKVPYSPLYVYELQYANAESIAKTLKAIAAPELVADNPALAAFGGVRDGDEFLRAFSVEPEITSNSLIIKAEKNDFLKLKELIKKMDVIQPQVALEVMIVSIQSTDDRELGFQFRNKALDTISPSIQFQNTGLPQAGGIPSSAVIDNCGPTPPPVFGCPGGLMGNLISLATNQSPGSLLISLGNAALGVWGLFKILQEQAHAHVVSHPFTVVANNCQARVCLGETRRVTNNIVLSGSNSQNAFGDLSANTAVVITPQISSNGQVTMDILVSVDSFLPDVAGQTTDSNESSFVAPQSRVSIQSIVTKSRVGHNQVLALGGLLKTTEQETQTSVPVLGDLPIVGWFFKNRVKIKQKSNLLIFIAPHIIQPKKKGGISAYTQRKAEFTTRSLHEMHDGTQPMDPAHRWFFKDLDRDDQEAHVVQRFLTERDYHNELKIQKEKIGPSGNTVIDSEGVRHTVIEGPVEEPPAQVQAVEPDKLAYCEPDYSLTKLLPKTRKAHKAGEIS